jgi:predicted RND superfamily exporter protein
MLGTFGPKQGARQPSGAGFFGGFAAKLARFDIGYRRYVIAASVVVLLVAIVGTLRVQTGTNFIKDFRSGTMVRLQYETISKAFGGANTFNIIIDGQGPDAIIEPPALDAIKSLQQWLAAQPEIGSTTSIVDHLRLLHRGFSVDPEAELPRERSHIKQLLVFAGGDEIESLIDRRFSVTNIVVRTSVDDTASIAALAKRIRLQLDTLTPPLTGRVTGHSVLIARTVDEIAQGQMGSLILAMTAIFFIMAALFTSYRAAGLALIPNVLPILVYFGALGLLGISLSPTTSLIACIALGVAADDTIHYFVRFNTDAKKTASETKATASALGETLRPITYTAMALCLGFLIMTTSELRNQVEFGLLAAFTLLVAWLANITLTPALASGVRIVTLWDVVRLDLGHDPQHSIPLMQGLTLRSARTFALLSDIMDLKAGSRVITEDEEGDDMYVVIDGQLRVWVERHDGPVDLAVMKRGDVIGEIGHFVAKRTANVDAVTDVRLLRFNDKSLDRLRRWRPWIAATVYRNLNRAQAERLARTTHMMR